MSTRYYDRAGNPLTLNEWAALLESAEQRHVALDRVGDDTEVSTVWLGLDHNLWGHGRPLIFETMVFGGELDGEQDRYSTEAEAMAGHYEMIKRCGAVSLRKARS